MITAPQFLIIATAVVGGGLQYYWRRRNQGRVRVVHKGWNYYADLIANNVLIAGGIAYVLWPELFSMANFPSNSGITVGGCVLGYLGLALWVWCQVSMGPDWSEEPTVWEDQGLTVSGPYRWVRHPMYVAFTLESLGIVLATANWVIMLVTLPHYLLIVTRVPYEERLLAEHFGKKYEQYARKTGRFWPIW